MQPGCPVEATVSVLDGKWKGVILHMLLDRTMRFGEIRKETPEITQRVLTTQVREFEADGLVLREIYAEVPPKVEYRLSPLGRSLEPVLAALKTWGEANMQRFRRATYDRLASDERSDLVGASIEGIRGALLA